MNEVGCSKMSARASSKRKSSQGSQGETVPFQQWVSAHIMKIYPRLTLSLGYSVWSVAGTQASVIFFFFPALPCLKVASWGQINDQP